MKKIFLLLIFFCLCCETDNRKRSKDFFSESAQKISNNYGNVREQLLTAEKVLDTIDNFPNDSLCRTLLFKIADKFNNLKKYNELKRVAKIIEQKSLEKNDSLSLAKSYRYIAYYYLKIRRHDSAYYFYHNSIKLSSKLGDSRNLTYCYYKLAILQNEIYDNWNAELSAIKAYKYAKNIKDVETQYKALMMMAIIANDLCDYKKAIQKNNEALHLIYKSKDTMQYTQSCINNLGAVYQNAGKHRIAISYFERAMDIGNLKREYPELYARLLNNRAYSCIRTKKFKGVRENLEHALKIRQKFNSPNDIVNSYNVLTEYYLAISDTLSAGYFGHLALQTAFRNGNSRSQIISLKLASEFDKRNSSIYIKKYIFLTDSLQFAERKNRNNIARIAFETEEITYEKDQAVKQKWIILIVAGSLFLWGISLFIIRMQRARQKELILVHEQQKSDEAIYQIIQDQQLKIDEGRQAEKKRISLELHDGVMNKLTSTRLNLYILNKKRDEETVKKCLPFINGIQDIEKEIRKVAHHLSDDLFSGNKSFNLVLQALFGDYKSFSSAEIHAEIDRFINWESVDNSVKMNLYRILQEILNNCNKYAVAKNIFITISKESDGVFVHTHDDGKGFDVNKSKKGIGLKNIAQRVQTLNGKLTIYSQPNEGTTISFFLSTVK